MKVRNHAFDLLCGLCILRMILLHCVSSCGFRDSFWFGKLMAWTFFFICFFFFKAGYFNKGIHLPFGAYCWDRVKRLLVPYLSWGIIGSIVFFGFLWLFPEELAKTASKLQVEHLWTMSHFYGNPPVWFLFSFFCVYLMVGIIHYLPRWGRLRDVLLVAFLIVCPALSYWLFEQKNPLWLSLNNLFMGLFFFYLGRLWREVQERIPHRAFLLVSIALTLVFLLGNHFWHGEYDMSLNKWVQHPLGALVNMTCALCGLSGVLLSFPLPRIPWVCYIGEHSMVYFVVHYPIIHYYRFSRAVFHRNIWGRWDDLILLFLIVLTICSWLVPYIERVPWLSGRWKQPATTNNPNT